MRIALLTPRFWPEVRRGTERFVHELATGLRQAGHEAIVVTSSRRPGRGDEDGIPVVRVPRLPERGLERAGLEPHVTHTPFAIAALRRVAPDVVHAFHLGDAFAAVRAGRWPVVYTHMGIPDDADVTARRGRRDRLQRVLDCAQATLVLSECAAAAMRASTGHEPLVIEPGVDLDRFPLGHQRTAHPTVVCAAAPDEPRKRVGLLVEAFSIVRGLHPTARLLLDRRGAPAAAGVEPVDMDDTAALAAHNGRAWAAVLPSLHEAFGLVLLEALATGTPVVGSRADALPELVDRPEIGRLFEGGAPELARAITETFELAARPETRNACRDRAASFSTARTTSRHIELYAELTARAGGSGPRHGASRRGARRRG